jgi:hypothetical protein
MLTDLRPPTADEVLRLIRSMPAKSLPIDAFPTAVIKNCANIFSVLITQLVSLSFKEGKFQNSYKLASVTPLLKKEGLDTDFLGNYTPISNLHATYKFFEHLFLMRLVAHVKILQTIATFSPPTSLDTLAKHHNSNC